jgi:acyl-CoA thioester hydrolase
MNAEPEAFQLPVVIRDSDVDALGHVNNTVYLRWVQEAATAHWRSLAPAEAQAAVAWVVLRHEIDYLHPAAPGDRVLARTWVGQAQGLQFERHTRILRAHDGRLLARARTLWCPIDARTGRPRRPAPEVRALFSTPERADAEEQGRGK